MAWAASKKSGRCSWPLPIANNAHAIEHTERIPYYVEQAVRHAKFGRPGPVYLDFPDDIIRGQVPEDKVVSAATVGEPPRSQAAPEAVEAALAALESAERPLVIVGKAWLGRGRKTKCANSSSAPSFRFWHRPSARASSRTMTRSLSAPRAARR